MEKNGNFWPGFRLDLVVLIVCVYIYIWACLHTCRMFTRERAAGQSREYQPRGGVERKHAFPHLFSSWHIIGHVFSSHQRPAHRVLLVLGAERQRAVRVGRERWERGSKQLGERRREVWGEDYERMAAGRVKPWTPGARNGLVPRWAAGGSSARARRDWDLLVRE